MQDYISGIQQIGIGVKNAANSVRQYARLFGMDTLVFNDTSEAYLMTRYTGGKVFERQALLSLNMQGGGGFEIWQFQNREPVLPIQMPRYGDLGIYAAKIKCADVTKAHHEFSSNQNIRVSQLQQDPKGEQHFWVKDPHDNVFNMVMGNHWFVKKGKCTGGVTGAVIGVSNMEDSLNFYQSLLNIHSRVYDETSVIQSGIDNAPETYRRVLLQKENGGKGAFGKLLGAIQIELVQCLDRQPHRIYENRFWGDCGFIHLCFDVFDMQGLQKQVETKGYRFTVDSIDSFGMENAAGRFCYLEDPDGTLIELVETHKVPILKKWGLYLNLKNRNLEKPLPDWMIRLLSVSKVK